MTYQTDEKHLTNLKEYLVGMVKIAIKTGSHPTRVAETMFSTIFGERNLTKTSKYYI